MAKGKQGRRATGIKCQRSPAAFWCPPPVPRRRDSDHLHKVRQLYEETEEQIRREKQQLQAQVTSLTNASPG